MPRKRISRAPPAPEKRSEELDDDDFFFDDTQSNNSGRNSHEPQHRNAANARERARMRVLSKAFCRLKTTLPWVPADTKLSKLDTLRLAASYIAHLRALLHEPRSAHTPPHPLSLAWPFTFQHGGSLSCTLSQRWNMNHNSSRTLPNNKDRAQETPTCENYSQEYENDYEERSFEDRNFEDRNYEEHCYDDNDCAQYCNYGYKDNHYYAMRNSYSTDNMMNSV